MSKDKQFDFNCTCITLDLNYLKVILTGKF